MVVSYEYIPRDICPSMMKIWIEEDTNTLHSMSVLGGCHGYLQSILRLLKGRKIEECISAL